MNAGQEDELRDRIESLESRVAALEQKHDQSPTEDGETDESRDYTGTSTPYDRYDQQVLAEIDDPVNAHPRELMRAYDLTGIVDRQKKKNRAKRLKKLVMEEGGK